MLVGNTGGILGMPSSGNYLEYCYTLLAAPENIYKSTEDLLTVCKAGGGLILGCSNAVVPETPIENYYAMLKAWQEYGHYNSGKIKHRTVK